MIENNLRDLKQKYLGTEKRFMGIDYGDVNIGIAISDVGRQIASPYKMLKNKSYAELFKEIEDIIIQMNVCVVVIGLPLQMNGDEGETSVKVRNFAKNLSEAISDIEIVFMDERLSSGMIEKMLVRDFDLSRKKRKDVLDKLAAAEILQRALDSI